MTPRSSSASSASRRAIRPSSAADSLRVPARAANDHSAAETPDALRAQAEALLAEAARKEKEAKERKVAEAAAIAAITTTDKADRRSARQRATQAAILRDLQKDHAFRGLTNEQLLRATQYAFARAEEHERREATLNKGYEWDTTDRDHGETPRIKKEIIDWLDTMGLMRGDDIRSVVKNKNGEEMSPRMVRYMMEKVAMDFQGYLGIERSDRGRPRYVLARTPEHLAAALKGLPADAVVTPISGAAAVKRGPRSTKKS